MMGQLIGTKVVASKSPEYLLDIIAQVVEVLLLKINVPREEAEAFSGRVKERHMGELFANFEAYDVQETRRIAREEARKEARKEVREEDIARAIRMMKEVSGSREITKQQLVKQFELSSDMAEERLRLYW